MSSGIKVFDITGAPNDEIDDVRDILRRNGIIYYETPRANFGISVAAIWVKNEEDYKKARILIDTYQKERRHRMQPSERGRNIAAWWKRKEILFFIFIVILLVWMSFTGVWRP
jgi:hypothetical protein